MKTFQGMSYRKGALIAGSFPFYKESFPVIPLYKERLLPDKKNYPPLTILRVNRSTSLPASCDHAIGHSKLHKRILLSRE